MSFTIDDLAAIDAVIASGELTVRFRDGRMITYQSTAALLQARALIVAELASAAGTARKRITRISQSGTGYGC